jgi:hypothetical protein
MADTEVTNDMVTPEDLAHLPGAPFLAAEVDGAVETIRTAIGWHIAPERSETYVFDVPRGETRLRLMTTHLVSIDEVRASGVVVDETKYEASEKLSILKHKTGSWASGYGAVEVDMTHGFEETPKDLLNIIAAVAASGRRDQSVREAVAGTYTLPLVGIDNVIYRYVPWHRRFGVA